MCTGARGTPLIPWPNRLADGAYTYAGTDYQVALTEPEAHNAIHGFLRWRNWTLRERDTDRVVLGTVLHPLPGYPFTLDVAIDYSIRDNSDGGDRAGLTVATTATNLGDTLPVRDRPPPLPHHRHRAHRRSHANPGRQQLAAHR